MIGLDYLAAGYLHLASADVTCLLKKAPEINVVASDTQVTYDNSKSQEQLDNFKNDTVNPYPKSVQTHVGGLMSGEVSIAHNIRIMQESFPSLSLGCLYLDSIRVEVHINPTIYIASNYPPGGCMYQAVMEHEKKHIRVDRMIVNKYSQIIVKALGNTMKTIGYAQGPFALTDLPGGQAKMQNYIKGVVAQYTQNMTTERRQLQQQVDTLAEYQRVQNLCLGKR